MSREASQNIDVVNQRIEVLERNSIELSRQVDRVGSDIATGLAAIQAKMDTQIASLNDKVNSARVPQWQIVIAALSLVIIIVGGLSTVVINPLKDKIASLDGSIVALQSSIVPRSEQVERNRFVDDSMDNLAAQVAGTLPRAEYDANRLQTRQDNANAEDIRREEFASVKNGLVSRGEHEQRWAAELAARADFQRQLDELKTTSASTYGVRDVLMDNKARIDDLERTIREIITLRSRPLSSQ